MELNLSIMITSQSRMENFSFRQFWVEYVLTVLPLHPDYQYAITKLLSCICTQLHLSRSPLFRKENIPQNLPPDLPILVFAAERILAYYITKQKSSKGRVQTDDRTVNVGYVADPSGGLVSDMFSWTESIPSKFQTAEANTSMQYIVPMIVCELSFLFHYCSTVDIQDIKIKNNMSTLRYRIIKFFESIFKLESDYACDSIMTAWDLCFENTIFMDIIEVKRVFKVRMSIIFVNFYIQFYQLEI